MHFIGCCIYRIEKLNMLSLTSKIAYLKNHPGFMRYFKNTSWLMGEKILRMVIGLFVGIWVARYLGPEQFGLFSYAQSFVFLFTAISTLGLDGIVVRELVKHPGKRDELLGTAFGLKFIGAIFILPVLVIAIQLTSNDHYTNRLILIIASATIFQSFNVIDFYYQSQVLSKYVALANSVCLGLSSIIKVALLINSAPLVAFVLMMLFDAIILSLGFIYFYTKVSRLLLINWTFEWQVAKCLLKDSWPLAISGLLVMVYIKLDQVMLKEFLGVDVVGVYAAGTRLVEAFFFISVVIASSIYPMLINSKKKGEVEYESRLRSLYFISIWLGLGGSAMFFSGSEFLIINLYGGEYRSAIGVVRVYAWVLPLIFLSAVFGRFLMIENFTRKNLYRVFCGAILNVSLNIIFIPRYGVVGAAYATLLTLVVVNIIYDIFDKDLRRQCMLKIQAIYRYG